METSQNNKPEVLEFRIPDWALPALINGDYSGLSEEENTELDTFTNRIAFEYGNACFCLPSEGEENEGFYWGNDINSLGGNCQDLYLLPSKQL